MHPDRWQVVRPARHAVVQSSYSRVFGLIDGAGGWLYTADANHSREELYDLRDGGPGSKPLRRATASVTANGSSSGLASLDSYYAGPLDVDNFSSGSGRHQLSLRQSRSLVPFRDACL